LNLLLAVDQVITTMRKEMKARRLVNIYSSVSIVSDDREGLTVRKNEAAPDLRLEAEWRSEKNASVPNAAVSATRI
jgi:hypothetical protein